MHAFQDDVPQFSIVTTGWLFHHSTSGNGLIMTKTTTQYLETIANYRRGVYYRPTAVGYTTVGGH